MSCLSRNCFLQEKPRYTTGAAVLKKKYKIIAMIIVVGVIVAGIAYYYLYLSRPPLKDPLVWSLVKNAPNTIKFYSPAFKNGGFIPNKYCVGDENKNPPLVIGGIPNNTKALVIVMYDPDAPHGTFYHWILYDIPPTVHKIPEGLPRYPVVPPYGLQGINSFGHVGYDGPAPPPGHLHHYYFVVMALDQPINLNEGEPVEKVLDACKGHVIAYGYFYGVYEIMAG